MRRKGYLEHCVPAAQISPGQKGTNLPIYCLGSTHPRVLQHKATPDSFSTRGREPVNYSAPIREEREVLTLESASL